MSFRLFIPDIEEISALLVCSHASSGKTVAVCRNGQVFSNLSAKSTINQWTPKYRVVQKAFLDIVGEGDGGKLGCFLAISLIRSLAKHKHGGHPDLTREVLSHLTEIEAQIISRSRGAERKDLVSLGQDLPFAESLADAVFLSGAESHISLEKYEGVGCEVVESESLYSEVRSMGVSEQTSLKGAMVALIPKRLSSFQDVAEPLELMGSFPQRPLLIVAPMIRGEALATIKKNRDGGVVEAYGVEAPLVSWGRGWLEDVASFTGGKLYDPMIYSEYGLEMYGSAREVTLKPNEIIIDPYDDHAECTSQRINQLLHEASQSPHAHTRDLWRKRASMLGGTLIRLKVGGVTEAEGRVNRSKSEKAITSMGMMLQGGCIDGVIPILSEIQGVHPIVDRALLAPLRVVALNNKIANLESAKSLSPRLRDPFPTERVLSLVRNSFSVATTLCSVAKIIKGK